MPERIQTPRRIQPRTVRPTASPSAAYVPPPVNTPDAQIASALSELSPALARLGGVLGQQKAERDRGEGQARAREMAEQGRTLAEEVRSGRRRPDESPWFKVGFYETTGRANGMKYVGDFLEALGNSPVAESVELDDFDKFEREFREQWVPANLGEEPDAFLANAFGGTVDGQMAGLRNEFARGAGDRMVKQNTEVFRQEIFEYTMQFAGTDLSSTEQAAIIRLAQDRQVATGGMTYEQANRITAEAIGRAAVRMRDTTILDAMDQLYTNANSKGVLGSTSYGTAVREKAETDIARALDDDARRESVIAARNRTAGINTVSSGLVTALRTDSGADITPFIDEMNKIDPTYIPTLIGLRDSIATNVYEDDAPLVQSLTVGIFTARPGDSGYTTRRDLDVAFGRKRMTLDTYLRLSGEIEKRDEAGGTGRFLRNPILTDIGTETRRIFVSEFRDETQAVRFNAQSAADEATYQMLDWMIKNPEASPDQVLAQKVTIRDAVIRRRVGVAEQVSNNSSGSQTTDVGSVPRGTFYIADPTVSGTMAREFQEIEDGRRNGFSPAFLRQLQLNNIRPDDLDAVKKFVREQTQWHSNGQPKP